MTEFEQQLLQHLQKSSGATDRASAFTVADHAAIDAAIGASKGDLGAAKSNIERAFENTKRNGRGLEGAVQGAERRVARNHLEGCAPAVAKQLGNVNHVLQQLVQYLPRIAHSIAAAAKAVTKQLQQATAKGTRTAHSSRTRHRSRQFHHRPRKKPPTAVFEPA